MTDEYYIDSKNKKEKNLNYLAKELSLMEGLEQSMSIAQIKEIIGLLGHRWRNISEEDRTAEINAIIERAGIESQHRD